MKTEQEIRREIENTKITINYYHGAYNSGKISIGTLKGKVNGCESTIQTLLWVLDEV
ncbi:MULTISPECIES: hypothetical protein [Bacillus]|uniref:hypothetical protein n=1 Tax=Bacillus TaxID=1386 RepID=UPI00031DC02B|nr:MULTISPECIES: hypothetical protein [Bacillus]